MELEWGRAPSPGDLNQASLSKQGTRMGEFGLRGKCKKETLKYLLVNLTNQP